MARIYNWVRGEGTVKNQRWGLGSEMDTPFVPNMGMGVILGANQNVVRNVGDEFYTQLDKFGDYVGLTSDPNAALGGKTLGQFVKDNAWLIGGGVLAVILLSRR